MNRSSLEHLIRAASDITGDREIIIVGSQAIHGSLHNIPDSAQVSFEADMYPRNMPEKYELIEALLGEESNFHNTYSYYAQGVGPETAVLPSDWETRAVSIQNASTNHASGICIGLHDLVLSKYAAGREKDHIYVGEVIALGVVDRGELIRLVDKMPADRCNHDHIKACIHRDFSKVELSKVISKIARCEAVVVEMMSRIDPEITLDLIELKDNGDFKFEKVLFEKCVDPHEANIQSVANKMDRGGLLHINELRKLWEKAKSLDPNIMGVGMSGNFVTKAAELHKSQDLPKSSFSDAVSSHAKDKPGESNEPKP